MSHKNRNYPEFQYSVVEEPIFYHGEIPPLNINNIQPWMLQGPRSVQHQMPSPSISERTAMTAPDPSPRSFNRSGFHHANRPPVDNNIDPHLPDLSMLNPSGHVVRSRYNPVDPIARHFQEERPWSAGNLRGSNAIGGSYPLAQANVQYGAYRGGPGSDMDSNVLRSDSGYHSQPPPSVFSNEPNRGGQELSTGSTLKADKLNVESAPSEAHTLAPMPSDQISQISSRSGKSGKPLVCPDCGEMSKCKSDLKKHQLRHEKPHKCNEPKCKRGAEGFITVNDLDRHKKSVHRIGLGNKSYRCASENCRNKEKIWPRLDNFKQHVGRMHKDEEPLDLIKRSAFKDLAPIMENITPTPMDTNLAVAGMEKSFSGNPAMDHVPIDITLMDQEPKYLTSPGQKPDGFAQDMYQVSSSQRGPVPENNFTNSYGSENPHSPPYVYQRASGTTTLRDPQTMYANTGEQILFNQPRPETQNQRSRPSLSNAPQTKAEQQRSALQKPRAVAVDANSSTSEPVDFEELVLSIIQKAAKSTNWDDRSLNPGKDIQTPKSSNAPVKITKSEAMKVSQAIATLIKQSPGSGYVIQRRSTHDSLSNAKVCSICNYAVARDCDLRKHMKRHEKPYGCTYPRCYKRFGAKSDWKRHENSQHFQVEAFRCAQPSISSVSPTTKCGFYCFRENYFKDHLNDHHKMSDPEQVAKEVEHCTIGKNCQVRYWCGFCTEVLKLEERQNAAWDERFDHIANHFDREKRSIDEWVCVEENRIKKESLKKVDRDVLEEEEDRDIDADGEDDDEAQAPPLGVPVERTAPRSTSPLPPSQMSQQRTSRKRPRSPDPLGPRKRKTLIKSKYCCNCFNGPLGSSQPQCTSCEHKLCDDCNVNEFMVSVDN